LKLGVEREEEEPGGNFSPRNRAVFEALRRGLLNREILLEEAARLDEWLRDNPD
jgi:hypothetical protein